MEVNKDLTKIYENRRSFSEDNSSNSIPELFASHNISIFKNDSIFIKLADTAESTLSADKDNKIQVTSATAVAKVQSKLILKNKAKKADKWLTISRFTSVIGLMVLGSGMLAGLCGVAGPLEAIGGSYIVNPAMNIMLLITIACIICSICIGVFYLYSTNKNNNFLEDFNNEKQNFQATIKLTSIVSDIFKFCAYTDDTEDKKHRADLFTQNIITTLNNKEIIEEMNHFLSIYNIIEKKLYYINSKIAKISKDNPLFQQQYEYIKMQGLQEIRLYSEKLENSSNRLFNLIFSNLSNNLDQADIDSIKQLKDAYIRKKLSNPYKVHKLFMMPSLEVTPVKNTIKNNLQNIKKDVQSIVMQAIENGAKKSF